MNKPADITAPDQPDLPSGRLWQLLRENTRPAHGALDTRIIAARPFADLSSYGRFLALQHDLHATTRPLYHDPALGALLPDLPSRDRFAAVLDDLADLGLAAPADGGARPEPLPDPASLPQALGWLYVVEGSNLGAAFLLKMARELGLSESHGARHMAPAPAGRGLHWRNFTAAMDAIPLSAAEEQQAAAEASRAFTFVHGRVEALLPAVG